MKNGSLKILFWVAFLCIIPILSNIAIAVSSTISSFSGQTNTFNISFGDNQNKTYYLDIPRYGYIQNVSLSTNSYYNPTCYQESANTTNQTGGDNVCNLNYNGNYSIVGYTNVNYSLDGYHGTVVNSNFSYVSGTYSQFNVTYVKPITAIAANWSLWKRPDYPGVPLNELYSIPQDCFNAFPTKVLFSVICIQPGSILCNFTCYNGSGTGFKVLEAQPAGSSDWRIWDENVVWTYNYTNKLFLGDYLSNTAFHTSNESSTVRNISTNVTLINSILSSGCSCTNCSISGSNCRIPFIFHSDTAGILETSLLNASYSYGIDNCSNSFGIPSNATAFDFQFINNVGSGVIVNHTSSLSYLSNTYFTPTANLNRTRYCIYPNWFNSTGDISFEYIWTSNLFTYFTDDSIFDNITNYVNFTIDTGATSVTATVYDQYGNEVEDVYIYVQKKDTSTGNYVLIGIYQTNFEGQTKIPLILDTVLYRFLLYYPISTLKKVTSPTYIYSTSINFQIQTEDNFLDEYFEEQNVYSNLTFLNDSDRFRWIYSDSSSSVTEACLKIYKLLASGSVLHNSSCLSSASGTIYVGVLNDSGTSYMAKGFLTIGGEETLRDSLSYQYPNADARDTIGYMGLLVDFLVTIPFAFLLFWSIPLALLLIPLPTAMLASVGFLNIDPSIAWGVEIAALVLAFIINRRG